MDLETTAAPLLSDAPAGKSRTLVEAAYAALRSEILDGTLPPGSRLRAEELKVRYKMGVSTLREALTRLLGEQLVTVEGQRGFRVAPISLEDFSDLTEVRKLIETQALRQAIRDGDVEWEARVVAAFYRLSKVEEQMLNAREEVYPQWEERNREFHRALISGCRSRWLHQMHQVLHQQSERYRRIAYMKPAALSRDVHAEHQAILDATLARDADLACKLTEDHIDRTLVLVRRLMGASDAPA